LDAQQHDLIQHVCKCPGMFVSPGSLGNVFAYLTGLDTATGCLTGFREWLLPRFEDGNNLAWPGVVQMLLKSESVNDKNATARLGELLDEFYAFTREDGGSRRCLIRVYLRYHAWLLNRSWYGPDCPGYISPYDGVPFPQSDQLPSDGG